MRLSKHDMFWLGVTAFWILCISHFHFRTPPSEGHIHLILMQSYFIPILIGAFQFGIKGGLGSAVVVSLIFTPHIMLQWTGDFEHNLLGFMQVVMFNVIGFLTGLKAQREKNEKQRYQKTAHELEQSLKKVTRQSVELAELEDQLRLSDRLAVVGELTASMAHELRNPLGTIRGTVEILNDELPEKVKKTDFFQILIQETERMSTVVENYLNFARKQKSPESQYEVGDVVRSTCLILASRARKERIRIKETMPDQPILLKGDPNDLRQILVNILLNAIESMSAPGRVSIIGELSVNNENLTSLSEDGKEQPVLRLSIKDSGKGMTSEDQGKIFAPFYTTKKNGTGLGLSIVKRIIEQHQWKIEVNSKLKQGTEFVLTIPLAS